MAIKKNSTRRLLMIIGVLFLVLIVTVILGRTVFDGGPDGITVETARADIRNLTQVVTASGKVQPEVEVNISPDVSGEIVFLGVNEGDMVDKGDLLVRIKPDFYQAQLEQATARVSQAKASLSQARANMLQAELDLNRIQDLYDKNVSPESELETVRTQYEVAKASFESAQFAVESAQAAEREAREQVNKTSIYAPMRGTISQLNVEIGERVVGTSQMAGTELMRVAQLNQMELEVDVNENDVVNVALDDSAAIEIDAYPERTFRGVVTEIANSARTTAAGTQEQVTNFPVKVRILDAHNQTLNTGAEVVQESEVAVPGASPQFRPGMSGTVDVFSETVRQVVAVPIQAVTVRDFNSLEPVGDDEAEETNTENTEATEDDSPEDGSQEDAGSEPAKEDLRRVVFVVDGGKAVMLEVDTGISDDTHIQIKSGLSADQTVIIGPYSAVSRQLRPGSTVTEQEERGGGFRVGG